MSEEQSMQQIILDTANKIFTDLCDKTLLDAAEAGEFSETLWRQVAETGFNQLGSKDSGTGAMELFAFISIAGRYAVPLPLAETLLVNRWCGAGDGVYSIGLVENGEIVDVPWGRRADKVVGVTPGSNQICVVDDFRVEKTSVNLAGEPRDTIAISSGSDTLELDVDPFAQLALARANGMAGALEALLDLGIQFATERQQFGRAISKFQAIQHILAVVAAETAAARRAADSAVDGLGTDRFEVEVAAAKSRVGESVTVVAEQVHQVHGAMGFTHEHRLHHFSRRAWAWRDEYGNEVFWQRKLGAHIAGLGADQAWGFIATRG